MGAENVRPPRGGLLVDRSEFHGPPNLRPRTGSAAVKRPKVRIRCFVTIALAKCRRRALLDTELHRWTIRTERASALAGIAFVWTNLLVRIAE